MTESVTLKESPQTPSPCFRKASCHEVSSTTVNTKIVDLSSLKPHLVPSHPQQRHTQTSGTAPFTSDKYQASGQNSARGRDSPTLSVMVTARERSAIERASLLAFSRSHFPAHSRGNPPQASVVTATPTLYAARFSATQHSGLSSELQSLRQ